MNLIFAGTPEFARVALEALCARGHRVLAVLTQPDRPAGRGKNLQASPVKQAAQARGLPVMQPQGLRDELIQAELRALGAEIMVVAAYGLILPPAVLAACPRGAINIHASLLPRWRGAAPIQRALLAGDAQTGVCIMQMEAGLDTGPVLLREAFDIGARETAGELHDRLAALGARLVVRAVDAMQSGPLSAQPQPGDGVTYAAKIDKAEARIDWHADAAALDRHVRAFNPFPGAGARLHGTDLKLWRAEPLEPAGGGVPGTVLRIADGAIEVACGSGVLRVTELQRPGGKRLPATEFLKGFPIAQGDRFEAGPTQAAGSGS